ncbi:MAG: ATP-binding cassette domain-containing protein, partial [Acidimicrobiales bacterium]
MLVAKDIVRHHGAHTVLGGVSLSIGAGARLGIVGPNGIGKSTLLRILSGAEGADGGIVERAPATASVGWLPQEPDAHAGETLRAYLARRTGVAAAEAELDRTTAGMTGEPDTIDAYSAALEHFLAIGGDDLDARSGAVLDQVGLPADRLDVEVGHLSGGQAARAALAAILLSRQDVLLLDEPTNDLDFAALDRLEAFVRSLASPLVVVSHDRAFLERTINAVVEIDDHDHT